MNKYNTFLAVFVISTVALICFLIFYLQAIFGLVLNLNELQGEDPSPFLFISSIFTPAVVISGVVLGLSSLVYRIMGIVYVIQNKTAKDGEKALWIVGFILMGFVTAIVFLILARNRIFVQA